MMKKAFTKLSEFEETERCCAHTINHDNFKTTQDILILTDTNSNIQRPGEIMALVQYVTDILIIKSAKKLHPPTRIWILPTERLHMTPQTIAGLRAHVDDINGRRVPVEPCSNKDLTDIELYKATYRQAPAPTIDIENVDVIPLAAPTHDQPCWPDTIGTFANGPPAPVYYEIRMSTTTKKTRAGGTVTQYI